MDPLASLASILKLADEINKLGAALKGNDDKITVLLMRIDTLSDLVQGREHRGRAHVQLYHGLQKAHKLIEKYAAAYKTHRWARARMWSTRFDEVNLALDRARDDLGIAARTHDGLAPQIETDNGEARKAEVVAKAEADDGADNRLQILAAEERPVEENKSRCPWCWKFRFKMTVEVN